MAIKVEGDLTRMVMDHGKEQSRVVSLSKVGALRMKIQEVHGDRLSRELTKCWREFRSSMKTTYSLAEEYFTAGLNHTLPFDTLAGRMASPHVLRTAKAFLARIESRLMLSAAEIPKVDYLLKRLSPTRRKPASKAIRTKDTAANIVERYPVRVFLCAYMILGHPEAVFNTHGDREAALEEAAKKLLPEFEALVDIVLNRPVSRTSGRQHKSFAAQLISFDTAWQSYLCCFVAWKVKDAQLLAEDLIRVACQLEVSMFQNCKVNSSSQGEVSDAEAIRQEIADGQRILRDRIGQLTGKTGLEKMEQALVAVRSKLSETDVDSLPTDLVVLEAGQSNKPPNPDAACSSPDAEPIADVQPPAITNEQMLNEIMHDGDRMLRHGNSTGTVSKIEEQARTIVEKAFWDRVEESLMSDRPEYVQVVSLVGEIRDELEGIVPETWKEGLRETLDLELVSQVLESGSNDFAYLGRLLDYTLDVILRLGAASRDEELKSAHRALIEDLSMSASPTKESFGKALVKGFRFVFERLQELKKEINHSHLALTQLLVNSDAMGAEYLRRAFAERYSLTPETPKESVAEKLPETVKWFRRILSTIETQRGEVDAAMRTLPVPLPQAKAPPAFPMSTGGRVAMNPTSKDSKQKSVVPGVKDTKMGPIKWGSIESVVRLGLLEIVSGSKAATVIALPETLSLNAGRLEDCQNGFQRVLLTTTGLLLLRQELMTNVPVPKLEEILKEAYKDLSSLLNEPLVTFPRIGSLLAGICAKHCSQRYPDVKASSEFMARMLDRSLSPGDNVSERVTATVRSSLRAILLVGNGAEGVSLSECSLKRIGGVLLVEDVVELAKKLDKISNISVQVHGLWYSGML